MPQTVELYVYDLAMGMASQFSGLVGFNLEGIWHTAIIAFGHEWFFGGSGGIEQCHPGGTMLGQPLKKVPLGQTNVDYATFRAKLREMGQGRFANNRYNLLENNCNNFSHELSKFLTGNGIPQYILDLPERVKRSPVAALIAPMIENLTPRGEGISGVEESQTSRQFSAPTSKKFRHFPHKEFIKFDQTIELDKYLGKLNEILTRNQPVLHGNAIIHVVETMSGLLSPSGGINQTSFELVMLMLKELPKEDVFPILDAIRFITSRRELSELRAKTIVDHINTLLRSERSSLTNLQLSVKILCNLFHYDNSKKLMVHFREILISRINSLMEEVEVMSNALQVAISTLVFNYAIVFLKESNQEASFQIISALVSIYIPTLNSPEALYRCIAALGTLICSDSEAKDLSLALDANVCLSRVKCQGVVKLVEVVEDCRRALI